MQHFGISGHNETANAYNAELKNSATSLDARL